MKRFFRRVLLGLVLILCVNPTSGQETSAELTATLPVARFSRAGRIASGPSGRLYVTERDRNELLIFSSKGVLEQRIGGLGAEIGSFDDPRDVDPGIGLVISVADTRNGRIQRFTKDLRFLESLPVRSDEDQSVDSSNPSFRVDDAGLDSQTDGRPVALTTSSTDDLYVIDATSRTVIRWDRDRRRRWTIGRGSGSDDDLLDPVDLVISSNLLIVADAGCACLVVYDLFGTFIRVIAEGRLLDLRAVDRTPGGILAVSRDKLEEFSDDGLWIRTINVSVPGDLVDVAYRDGRFILLTETGLYFAFD